MLALVVGMLCVGCGPSSGSPNSDAGESVSGAETGMSSGCGDGQPERGVFCFEQIDVPEVYPAHMEAVDAEGGRQGIMGCLGPPPPGMGRALGYLSLVDGQVEIVGSDLPCWRSSDWGGIMVPGRFRPDLGPEVATIGRGELRLHSVSAGEIVFRETPYECGEYDSYACNPVVAAVDVDGDGVLELLAYDHAPGSPKHTYLAPRLMKHAVDDAWVLGGPTLPDFRSSGSWVAAPAVGDLGLEVSPAFVFAHLETLQNYDPTYHQIVVAFSRNGELVEHWRAPAGTVPLHLGLGDLDGDGVLDLAVSSSNALAVLRGTGAGTFAEPQLVALAGEHVNSIAVGDFDGDGVDAEIAVIVGPEETTPERRADLVIVDDALGETPTFVTVVRGFAGGGLVAADLTGNGVPDLVLRNWTETSHLMILQATP